MRWQSRHAATPTANQRVLDLPALRPVRSLTNSAGHAEEVDAAISALIKAHIQHHDMIVHATLSATSVVKALAETVPGFYESFQKHSKESQDSPYARQGRDIWKGLSVIGEAMIARAKKRDEKDSASQPFVNILSVSN